MNEFNLRFFFIGFHVLWRCCARLTQLSAVQSWDGFLSRRSCSRNRQVLLKKKRKKIDLPCCPRAARVGVCFIFSSSRSILFFTVHFIYSDVKFEALTFEWPQRILFYHSHSLRARTWTSKARFHWSENLFLLYSIQPWRTSRWSRHIQAHLSQGRVEKRIRL